MINRKDYRSCKRKPLYQAKHRGGRASESGVWVCLLSAGRFLQKRGFDHITLLLDEEKKMAYNNNCGFECMYKSMFGSLKLMFHVCHCLCFSLELYVLHHLLFKEKY
ncbi:hypothetical protein L1987_36151 [Smallanthus sonchifolius]|uniref:Uncharacterized protein n=1 Tax=Smallanthus sonchifolius TaxID=185202 RepID=A0ACB9HD96_9ASTR|nr:hypothetical protein L1987_36151 [Smallanthus sonchifolius]